MWQTLAIVLLVRILADPRLEAQESNCVQECMLRKVLCCHPRLPTELVLEATTSRNKEGSQPGMTIAHRRLIYIQCREDRGSNWKSSGMICKARLVKLYRDPRLILPQCKNASSCASLVHAASRLRTTHQLVLYHIGLQSSPSKPCSYRLSLSNTADHQVYQ